MNTFEVQAKEFLSQQRIAVAGVSRSRQDAANLIYRKLRESGYKVYPVNPNADVIEGDTCYPNLKSIPSELDGVVIVTRPDISEQVAYDCVEAGVPRVWMHNNTFAPSSVSDSATEYCRQHGISVIPGGCPMMFFDFGHKCMRWMLGVMGRLPA